jgi:hypothetical protein
MSTEAQFPFELTFRSTAPAKRDSGVLLNNEASIGNRNSISHSFTDTLNHSLATVKLAVTRL